MIEEMIKFLQLIQIGRCMIGDPLASCFLVAARSSPLFNNLLVHSTNSVQNDVDDHMIVFARAMQVQFSAEKSYDRIQMIDFELMIDA